MLIVVKITFLGETIMQKKRNSNIIYIVETINLL